MLLRDRGDGRLRVHDPSQLEHTVSHTVSRDADSVIVCVWIRTHALTHTHTQAGLMHHRIPELEDCIL